MAKQAAFTAAGVQVGQLSKCLLDTEQWAQTLVILTRTYLLGYSSLALCEPCAAFIFMKCGKYKSVLYGIVSTIVHMFSKALFYRSLTKEMSTG